MAKITISFLIVHKDFQDTISYDVDEAFTFEDVIIHICDSFGFVRNQLSITSNLGMEIDDLHMPVQQVASVYGEQFRIVVKEANADLVNAIAHRIDRINTEQGQRPTFEFDELDEPEVVAEPMASTDSDEIPDLDLGDEFFKVITNLSLLNTDNWKVDNEGMVELIILPQINTYISQLRVKIRVSSTVKQLFTKVALTCGFQMRQLKVAPLQKIGVIIDDMDITVQEMLQKYGSVFILHPLEEDDEAIIKKTEDLYMTLKKEVYNYQQGV